MKNSLVKETTVLVLWLYFAQWSNGFVSLSFTRSCCRARPLQVSVEAPPIQPVLDDDDSGHQPNFGNRYKSNIGRERPTQHFRSYLRRTAKHIKSKKLCAQFLDDELEKMELRWFGGQSTNPPRYTGHPRGSYRGPTVQPDISCYALAAKAYAKANMGRKGAECAEAVLKRCENYNQNDDDIALKPNAVLWTAVMTAWARADCWHEAEEWLNRMEETYAKTNHPVDAPDVVTYTSYMEALASSKTKKGKEVSQKAKEVLAYMHELSNSGKNVFAKPNHFSYASAIKCQSRAGQGAGSLVALLRELQDLYHASGGDPLLKAGSWVYVPILNFLAHRGGGGLEAAELADSLKGELEKLYKETGDPSYRPFESVYASVITAYSHVEPKARKFAIKRSRELLAESVKTLPTRPAVHLYTSAINSILQHGDSVGLDEAKAVLDAIPNPDTVVYQLVIHSFVSNGRVLDGVSMLKETEQLVANGTLSSGANLATYVECVEALIKEYRERRDFILLEKANCLLETIVEIQKSKSSSEGNAWIVDRNIFDRVIQQWGTCRHEKSPENAEAILKMIDDLKNLAPDRRSLAYQPYVSSYTYALDAWAISGRKDAGQRALELLQKMRTLHKEDPNFPAPNNRVLSCVLTSVTKSDTQDAATISQDLLRQCLKLHVEGDQTSKPTPRSYTSVLRILASEKDDGAIKALNLFKEIRDLSDERGDRVMAPNMISYNCILFGLGRGGFLEEAKNVFKEMKMRYKDGHEQERPSVVTYSTMIETELSCSKDTVSAALRAEELLMEMEDMCKDDHPDTMVYNSVLRSLAMAAEFDPSAPERAHAILRKMEKSSRDESISPNLISYTLVCQAYANSNITEAAETTERLLHRVDKQAAKGKCDPVDLYLYTLAIRTYGRSKVKGAMYKAEALFDNMEKLFQEGRSDLRPNIRIVNALLSGWARSSSPRKAERASAFLKRTKALYEEGNNDARPDLFTHNWVIKAAGRTRGGKDSDRLETFSYAVDAFKQLHQMDGVEPDASTYIAFLRACTALLPQGDAREKLVSNTLRLASNNGLVSGALVKNIKYFEPEVLNSQLSEAGIKDLDNAKIPAEWSRNL